METVLTITLGYFFTGISTAYFYSRFSDINPSLENKVAVAMYWPIALGIWVIAGCIYFISDLKD